MSIPISSPTRTRHLATRSAGWALAAAMVLTLAAAPAPAQTQPYDSVASRFGYGETVERIDAAVKASPLAVVTRASATVGARSLGKTLPGNMVLGLFAPQYALRMLAASVEAGFEAPVRLYIVEAPDGKVTVRYRRPSVVFAPYRHADLDAMAGELDAIFAQIVSEVR